MEKYKIDITKDAKIDLHCYSAFAQKIIVQGIRSQLSRQPTTETKNRKNLRSNLIAAWELRSGKYRIFYEVDETRHEVTIVAIGHKEHNRLFIRGEEVKL